MRRNSKGQFVRLTMKERVLRLMAKGITTREGLIKATGWTGHQVSRTLWQLGDQVQQVERGVWAA